MPIAFDLFAGCGGLSTGLEKAGFDVIFANEVHDTYAASLQTNHPDTEVLVGDIREVDPLKIQKNLDLKSGELDLLAGGPPCQGFSINAPSRSIEDTRNHLFKNFLRFAAVFQPKLILIENVPGMISFERGDTVRAILEALRQEGYSVSVRILFSPNFGVPQIRWRTIIVGNRLGLDPDYLFPVPSHRASGRANFTSKLDGLDLKLPSEYIDTNARYPHTTVWDAISDLPPLANGEGLESQEYVGSPKNDFQRTLRSNSLILKNHVCAGLGATNLKRLEFVPPGGSWRDIPFELLPKGLQRARRSDHTKRYGRLEKAGLASTILTKCDPHWGSYFHPEQDRIISVREAARLQSFPDKVTFAGSLSQQYEQVGNAVPPYLGAALGEQFIFALTEAKTLAMTNGLAGSKGQLALIR